MTHPSFESVEAELSFTRPGDVSPDEEHPQLGRARTLRHDALLDHRSYEQHRCRMHDCSALEGFVPSLGVHGFTRADLSSKTELQGILEQVRAAGAVREAQAEGIRRCLRGARLRLSDGRRLWLLFIAPEGFLMRKAGPNGLSVNPTATQAGMNEHDAAMAVHIDQDVTGTPIRQILRGAAPWLFHHASPKGANARSPLFLVNLWIPLEQVTRPLALLDQRSLDRRRHQLRYALPTDRFLQREPGREINDLWTLLHDRQQRWYFSSQLDSTTAYVFNTLGTPHAAFVLPGEQRAEVLYRRIRDALDALERGDEGALRDAADGPDDDHGPEPATLSLRRAIEQMQRVLAEARTNAHGLCDGDGAADWRTRARRASDRVIRKSLEMRVIGLMLPPLGAQGR